MGAGAVSEVTPCAVSALSEAAAVGSATAGCRLPRRRMSAEREAGLCAHRADRWSPLLSAGSQEAGTLPLAGSAAKAKFFLRVRS